MICLNCGEENFTINNCSFHFEIKGKSITIEAPAFVCRGCCTKQMNIEQMQVLINSVDLAKLFEGG